MPLPRNVLKTETFERVELDVWDIETKTIIHTGTGAELCALLGCSATGLRYARKNKTKFLGKYAIRIKSDKK